MFRIKFVLASLRLKSVFAIVISICAFSSNAIAETDDLEDKRHLKRLRLFFEGPLLSITLPVPAEEPESAPEDEPPADDLAFESLADLDPFVLMAAANAPVTAADIDELLRQEENEREEELDTVPGLARNLRFW